MEVDEVELSKVSEKMALTRDEVNDLVQRSFPDIKSLSPSSLNKWCGEYGDEGSWCLTYIYNKRFQGSPATIRGQVVEDAFFKILKNVDGGPKRLKEFVDRAYQERVSELDNISAKANDKEFSSLHGFVDQCYLARKELKLVLPKQDDKRPTQVRVTADLGSNLPIKTSGYLDFDFGDYALDLKTTHAVPSSDIKQDHKCQIGMYAKARGDDTAKILYLSSKKYRMFALHGREIDTAHASLVTKAEGLWYRLYAASIMALHNDTDPKDEISKLVTPNFGSWNWDDEAMSFAASLGLWNIKYNG